MTTLKLQAVKKSFGKTDVIHGVDIDVRDGEFIVVVGPSGCGKSTLLRMIAGLETVTAGDIFINDEKVNDHEPMERNVAMVFQNYALYPHMSVFDNMAYSLKIAGLSKADIKERVGAAAELLQISDYLQRKPRQLSGGQRQRVAMGRAIVRKPALFLFDEPLSNLDAKLRVQMRLEIKKLQRKLRVTSVYVTHDQVEAMTMGDRLLVLNGGYVEQFGTPIELYQHPASTFVAQFIGSPSMNLLAGVADGNQVYFENGSSIITETPHQGDVIVGLRPEHLLADNEGSITFATEAVEQLGSVTLLHGMLPGSEIPMVVSLPGIHDSMASTQTFSAKPEHIHLFDKDSGKRITA